HGYNHPVLNRALATQAQKMAHVMFGGLTHPPAVELAELLVGMTPCGLDRVFFSDSGSVAVEVALKMAIQYWQGRGRPRRQKLMSLRNGYHGDTLGAMSLCDPSTGMHHLFSEVLPKQLFAPRPTCLFEQSCAASELADVESLLINHGQDIAAVIVEPIVQGAGGMHFYSPEYLVHLRSLCDQHEVLLIFDEIATGFGRTGALFALEHAAVVPDILCLGKALTGGYMTLAATLCSDRVSKEICASAAGAFMHGPTFMANPLACAVATASINLLLSQPWQRRLQTLASELIEGLTPAADLASVADVRVLGGIGVIELKKAVDLRCVQPMFVERGVWVRPFGKLVYVMPPYVMDSTDIATLTAAMVDVVAQL
ncbi:MAG: adenosylmethionine--8-amino-7-oxononanoate transaminase, partial [Halioglobus sp.]|nr:adenosylmethionine--8-amino-7-oxononanoate transaminase [Halioglobus sp.]